MSHYWKSLIVVFLAVIAWAIVPLGMLFHEDKDSSSYFPLHLLTGSALLAVIAMCLGHIINSNSIRLVKIAYDFAKAYLFFTGLLLMISIVLSYTGK
ncbi:hypothetical protein Q7I35_17725 [Aeromonas allosaccharophila]|uniref:hypothetical protein n=1 Tax=Aeromonas TaxID=642 RepID=UPI0011D13824|nr:MULTISPECIES: hypothetical protein [Aeromonas]MEB8286793.1 hypothetical protein [Aeromonas veronii]